MALARVSGHRVVRINLSEQTDIMDLLGAELPIEDGQAGQFEWRDGALLQALRAGDWVLLDEMNLASQSVLEGLNACLDHRAVEFWPGLRRRRLHRARRSAARRARRGGSELQKRAPPVGISGG